MKKKCEKCRGKGGWTVTAPSIKLGLGKEYFKPCLECMGKGSWYTNNHGKNKPKVDTKRR